CWGWGFFLIGCAGWGKDKIGRGRSWRNRGEGRWPRPPTAPGGGGGELSGAWRARRGAAISSLLIRSTIEGPPSSLKHAGSSTPYRRLGSRDSLWAIPAPTASAVILSPTFGPDAPYHSR